MTRPEKSLVQAFVFLLALGLAESAGAQVTSYPSGLIKMIMPFPPGGPTDVVSRIVGQKLAELWGQPVIVENRAGADGTIGVGLGAKAPPRGLHDRDGRFQ